LASRNLFSANAICKKYLPMDARTNLNDRLPGWHVTGGSRPMRQLGSCDPAAGPSAAQIDQACVGVATGGACDLLGGGEVFKRTPYIADLKPAGRFVAKDLSDDSGIPLVMKTLLENGFLHGECLTVTGCSVTEKLHRMAWSLNRDADRPVSPALGLSGGVSGLRGNLDPDGAIVNIGGPIDHSGDGNTAIDAECGSLDTRLSDTEFDERPVGRRPAFGSRYLWRFSRQVGAAHHGAVARQGGSAEKTCYADI
jgi:dihydroxyacid dehydratase/phosphogluconate dehydratase